MTRTFWTIALLLSIASLATREAAAGGRGGGYGGGGAQRGSYGGGGRSYEGGGGYGGMSHSPSVSQPRPSTNESANERNNPNAGAAAAGADYANKNQATNHSEAGAAAVGAGASNRNQPASHSNAGAAAVGAGASNRNQSGNYSNAGAAAAGADYADRNKSPYSNAGAGAAGATYANRNQSPYSNAGAAAAGASYANNRNGTWNGNYGAGSMGAYGGMGMASPAYGYGSSPYVNPYAGMMGAAGVGQPGGQGQAVNNATAGFDYAQPVNTAAAPTATPPPNDSTASPNALARQAFQSGDYAGSVLLTQQALGQAPNDTGLHQLLALAFFAQGKYDEAAAPLYAVLAVGPGWDWTTLIDNYPDAGVYTVQLRGLEAYVKDNPGSAKAPFVEAYHYICQGHGQAAIKPLKAVVALQSNDGVSARLLENLQPQTAPPIGQPLDPGKLSGVWVAPAAQNAKITLTISGESNFSWTYTAPDKPPVTINGPYTLANGILTLSGKDAPGGPLAGKVTSADDNHLSFLAIGAPPNDPGLQFVR